MFAILRVEPVHRLSDLLAATAHGARQDGGTHYDPARSHLNRHWRLGREVAGPVDLAEAREALIKREGLLIRSNGAVAAELLLTASSDFFYDEAGGIDEERLEHWVQRNIGCIEQRFPGMVAAMRLDRDESTPHLAAFLVPFYTKATRHHRSLAVSYRQVFGAPTRLQAREKMIELQDLYVGEMSEFGLQRGVPKKASGRSHLTHHEYERRKRLDDEKRERTLVEVEQARAAAELMRAEAEDLLTQAELRIRDLDERDAVLARQEGELMKKIQQALELTVYSRRAAATMRKLASPAYLNAISRATAVTTKPRASCSPFVIQPIPHPLSVCGHRSPRLCRRLPGVAPERIRAFHVVPAAFSATPS